VYGSGLSLTCRRWGNTRGTLGSLRAGFSIRVLFPKLLAARDRVALQFKEVFQVLVEVYLAF